MSKRKIVALIVLFFLIGTVFLERWMLLPLGLVLLAAVIYKTYFFATRRILSSNWFNNLFLYTRQFVSNAGYRKNLIRNYEVVNLGSNPALFAFFYEDLVGQNWSTGSQGYDMDYEILKYYHSYLKEGATVIIPIMPFSAISPFIKTRKGYWDEVYYAKFAKILSPEQVSRLPYLHLINKMSSHPILWRRDTLKYVFSDVERDNRLSVSEQIHSQMELKEDAERWIRLWKKEFCLDDLKDVLRPEWDVWIQEASSVLQDIVTFCLERGYKPVLVYPPMTKFLADKFSPEVCHRLISDFVRDSVGNTIPFYDYSLNDEFRDPSLFYDSFFLNLRGRKVFSKRLFQDLGLTD